MKFKLTFITLLMTVSLLQVFGQERTNREKLVFVKTSPILSKATGWAYNTILGEWISYKNFISDDKSYKTDKTFEEKHFSYFPNFLNMQSKTVTYKGITYYVLIVESWDKKCDYSTSVTVCYPFKKTEGYIFTKEEYQKLINFDALMEIKTKYFVELGSKYEKYDETKFLDLIQNKLSEEKNDNSTEYLFKIMKSKEGAIRFFLPGDSFFLYKIHDFDFEKKYFETDFESFTKLIIK